jgi:hypothetical protein
MKTIMIIQNMRGNVNDILSERERVVSYLMSVHGNNITVVDMYVDGPVPDSSDPKLWRLSKRIQKLAGIDIAYFVHGWKDDVECVILHSIAESYNINFVEL